MLSAVEKKWYQYIGQLLTRRLPSGTFLLTFSIYLLQCALQESFIERFKHVNRYNLIKYNFLNSI